MKDIDKFIESTKSEFLELEDEAFDIKPSGDILLHTDILSEDFMNSILEYIFS